MDPRGLEASHSADPVRPAALAGLGYLGGAPDPDPHYLEAFQGRS
jgi:hypothetical protein